MSSALIDAILRQDTKKALELIKTGDSQPSHVDHSGNTALILACRERMADVALELIKTGDSQPSHVDHSGNTALMFACREKMTDVALELIKTGQSLPEHKNLLGLDALSWACRYQMTSIIDRLSLGKTEPCVFIYDVNNLLLFESEDYMQFYTMHGDALVNGWFRQSFSLPEEIKYYRSNCISECPNLKSRWYFNLAVGHIMWVINQVVINRGEKKQQTVFRGSNDGFYAITVDNNISFSGLLSTSKKLRVARAFGDWLTVIELTKDTPQYDVEEISNYPDEAEVLLPLGAYFVKIEKPKDFEDEGRDIKNILYLRFAGVYPNCWDLWKTNWPIIMPNLDWIQSLPAMSQNTDVQAQFAYLLSYRSVIFWDWYNFNRQQYNWSPWPVMPLYFDILKQFLRENEDHMVISRASLKALWGLNWAQLLFEILEGSHFETVLDNCSLLEKLQSVCSKPQSLEHGNSIDTYCQDYTVKSSDIAEINDNPIVITSTNKREGEEKSKEVANMVSLGCLDKVVLEGLVSQFLSGIPGLPVFYGLFRCRDRSYLVTGSYPKARPLEELAGRLTFNDKKYLLQQLILSLYLAEITYEFNHNDLTSKNILIINEPYPAHTVSVKSEVYSFPETRYQAQIINLGFSRITDIHHGICIFNEETRSRFFAEETCVPYVRGKDLCHLLHNDVLVPSELKIKFNKVIDKCQFDGDRLTSPFFEIDHKEIIKILNGS